LSEAIPITRIGMRGNTMGIASLNPILREKAAD
jgi:hypothetical protein